MIHFPKPTIPSPLSIYSTLGTQLQPDYAAAWTGLGDSYAASAVAGEIPPQEAFAKAEAAARKALRRNS
jgi:hypothetical protein